MDDARYGARTRRRGAVLAATLVAGLLAALPLTGTFADTQVADTDVVQPGIQHSVVRTAEPGDTVSVSVRLQIEWSGSSHLTPGSTVGLELDPGLTVLPPGAVASATSITIPTEWASGAVAVADEATTLTFTAPKEPGYHLYHAVWGTSGPSGDLEREDLHIVLQVTAPPVVEDTTPPVVQAPPARTVEATGSSGAVVTYAAGATDDVDGALVPTCAPASGTTFALGSTVVTCSATDAAGNTGTASTTVTVVDTTPPALPFLTDLHAGATIGGGIVVTFTEPDATDAVDGSVPIWCEHSSGDTFDYGDYYLYCFSRDAHSNIAARSYKLVVRPGSPVLLSSDDIHVGAASATGANVPFDVLADDAVDGPLVPTCNVTSGATFPIANNLVHCQATDSAANTVDVYFRIRVADTTAPVITAPDVVVASATSAAGATATFTATAVDAVDGTATVTCSQASGSTFALGVTTVLCSATDAAGNVATRTVVVRVVDDTPPVLQTPGDLFGVEATSAAGYENAPLETSLLATDAVDGWIDSACDKTYGADLAIGPNVITCRATDAAGNTAVASFTIEVVDTTAPALELPEDVTAEATSSAGAAVPFEAVATDLVSGVVAVSCDHTGTFPLGTTTVTCTATDDHGNVATGSFDVTVADTTAPVVTGGDVTLEAAGPAGATAELGEVTVTDAVDAGLEASCTPAAGTTFAVGATSVTCTATDASGNVGTATFTVTVSDTAAPNLVLPAALTVEATGPDGALAEFATDAVDAVSGPVDVDCDHESGETFALGDTEVTCTATDGTHVGTGTFTVHVVDTTAPELDVPSGTTVEATGPDGAPATFTASATDAVDGTVAVTCSSGSGATFPVGATVVTCSAVDAAGNTAQATFTVVVDDTTAPALDLPGDHHVEATGPNGAQATFSTSATDLVDGNVLVVCDPPSTSSLPLGPTEVSCSAIDSAGNVALGGFTVTVSDTTAPVVSVPTAQTIEATGPTGAATTWTASATDAVTEVLGATCDPDAGSLLPLGPTTITCSATDAAGNTGTASFTVTVVDTTGPVVTAPTVSLGAVDATGAVATYAGGSAVDAVDGPVTLTCDPPSGTRFALGASTVSCLAADGVGNTSTSTFVVTVSDTDAPSLTLPSAPSAEATSATGAAVTWTASATDGVDGPLPVTCSPASGATLPLGPTTVTCSATDAAGNTATGSFTAYVVDTTAPTVNIAGGIGGPADAQGHRIMQWQTSVPDAVDGQVPLLCTPPSGTVFNVGSVTVHCTATDAAGNTTNYSFSVTITDPDPPVLTLPNVVELTSTTGSAVGTWTATAQDTIAGNVPVTCSPASGSTFATGSTTVTCSATDGWNTTSGTFTVTLGTTTRIEVPEVTIGSAGITSGAWYLTGSPLTGMVPLSDFDCSNGKCPVVLRARYTFTNTEPTRITLYGMRTTSGCTCRTWSLDNGEGTAFDDRMPSGGIAFQVPLFTTGIIPPGSHYLTFDGYDDSTFKPDFIELTTRPPGTAATPPTLTLTGTGVGTQYTATATASLAFNATARDVYGTALTPSCSRAVGDLLPGGDSTTTCTATDSRGNSTTRSFTTHVIPNTTKVEFPDLTFGGGTVPAGAFTFSAPSGANVIGIADDECSSGKCSGAYDVTYTFTAPAGTIVRVWGMRPTGGRTDRTWQVDSGTIQTFSDAPAAANQSRYHVPLFSTAPVAAGTHVLRIKATGNPILQPDYLEVITDPSTVEPFLLKPLLRPYVTTSNPAGATVAYTVEARDSLGAAITPSCSPAPGVAVVPLGTTTATCVATDSWGHSASISFPITVGLDSSRGEAYSGYVSTVNSPPWIQSAGSGTQVPAVNDNRCTSNLCGRFETGTHPFTLTKPGRVVVYGTKHAAGCACRTWSLNGGFGSGTFSDWAPSPTQWEQPLFATPYLPPGSYTLVVTAHSGPNGSAGTNSTIKLDYSEIEQFPVGTLQAPPILTVSGGPVNGSAVVAGSTYTLSYTATAKSVEGVAITPVCTHPSGSTIGAGTTTTTCTATDVNGQVATVSFWTSVQTGINRVEVPFTTSYSGTMSSPPWFLNSASTTGVYIFGVQDPRCSGGGCANFYTAQYTFTVSQPSVLSAYGLATTAGCACRQWKLDSGPLTSFSDSASAATSSYRRQLFTTGTIAPGSHTLYVYGNVSPGNLRMDFVDITPA